MKAKEKRLHTTEVATDGRSRVGSRLVSAPRCSQRWRLERRRGSLAWRKGLSEVEVGAEDGVSGLERGIPDVRGTLQLHAGRAGIRLSKH